MPNVCPMRLLPIIITITALALIITPTLAADVTIPVAKDYTMSDGIVVHFDKVIISDDYHGNTYSPDPANTKWYDLYFTYANKGTVAQTGHLEVSFYDVNGKKYPDGKNITDMTMDMLEPGTASDKERFVEAAVIPKDTKIAGFQVFDGFKSVKFDIAGGQTGTSTTSSTANASAGNGLCLSALLPFFIVGIVALGRIKR